jgi:uncharacterized protein (TIGR04255 family)
MHENVCYESPFLKEVIVRIDFASPVEALSGNIPSKIGNEALSRFPISEPRKMLTQELQFSDKKLSHRRQEFMEWNYHGIDREKRLKIAPNFVLASFFRYSSYELLKDDFVSIIEKIFSAYPDLRGSRLGLRYINKLDPRDANPFEWAAYIDQRILGLFSRFTDREHITRLFNITEFKYDDIQVKFQFGAPNPDFPAVIRRPLFVLDIDAYVQGLQDFAEITGNMDRAHDRIQTLFEESITDELRGLMRARQA